jgi:hypothetical protein
MYSSSCYLLNSSVLKEARMKALSKGLFWFSLLLMAYGLVAALLGLSWFIYFPKYAEAAILGGVGLGIMICRYEVALGMLHRDMERLAEDVTGVHKDIVGVQANVEKLQASVVGVQTDVERFHKDVGGLHENVGGFHENIGELHKDVGGLHREVGELHKDIGELLENMRKILEKPGA